MGAEHGRGGALKRARAVTDTNRMTETNSANAYLRTKVMSASPAELRLMLIDGAIKFASQAREGLAQKDYEQSYNGFTQCRAIVLELMTTIKPEPDPEFAERVRSLYAWFYTELVESSLNKDIPRLDKVIELLEYERETWVMVMEKIGAGGANAAVDAGAAAPSPAGADPSAATVSAGISFQA